VPNPDSIAGTFRHHVGDGLANLSLILTGHAVSLANGLAAALAGQGASPQSAGAAGSSTCQPRSPPSPAQPSCCSSST
jgi:hypothetical protein